MSHPRCRLLDNRKYQRSGSDVDRTVLGDQFVEAAPPGVEQDASRTKVVAVGEGPLGEGPLGGAR